MFDSINFRSPEFQHTIWLATGGSILVLFQSILSGTRRVWWRLLLSCIIGGGGSALAGMIFSNSKFVYFYCGVAAIMSENLIFGFFKASEEFRESPIQVFSQLFRLIMPTLGKVVGEAAKDVGAAPSAPATPAAAPTSKPVG